MHIYNKIDYFYFTIIHSVTNHSLFTKNKMEHPLQSMFASLQIVKGSIKTSYNTKEFIGVHNYHLRMKHGYLNNFYHQSPKLAF